MLSHLVFLRKISLIDTTQRTLSMTENTLLFPFICRTNCSQRDAARKLTEDARKLVFMFCFFRRASCPALFLKVKNAPCLLLKVKIAPCLFLEVKNAPCLFSKMKNNLCPFSTIIRARKLDFYRKSKNAT